MKPSQLVLKPSHRLVCLLVMMSFFACVLILYMPFGLALKTSAIGFLMLIATHSIARDALLALPWSPHALHITQDDDIVLTQKNGKELIVKILPTSLVTPQLMVLNLRAQSQILTRSIVVLADSVDANHARLWRVWLKWRVKF